MKNLNSYLDRLTAVRMRPEVLQHAVDILKAVPLSWKIRQLHV